MVHRVLSSLAQNTAFVEAFLNEAGVAGTLKHPNFIELYDLGELEGQHFVAEEYVAGGSLHELLDRRGDELLPLGVSLFIVGEVCAGLQFAHALADPDGVPRNLVHKAINPRHVIVSIDGVVKISDFGMSSALALLGVPPPGDPQESEAFLAPEQQQGAGVDRRADIYSSGALLYRLITGTIPVRFEEGELKNPRDVVADLPEVVEALILKATASNPRERHPTCGALRRDISNAIESLKLQSDLASLSAVIRAEFPEVSGRDEGVEDTERPTNPSSLSADSPDATTRPHKFPGPIVANKAVSSADSQGDPEEEAVPFLDDDDFIEDATERLPGLTSMDQVDQILAAHPQPAQAPQSQPQPVEKRRSIWLWVAIATFIGAFGATAIGLAVVLYMWQPWSPNQQTSFALPGTATPTLTPAPISEPPTPVTPSSPTPPISPASMVGDPATPSGTDGGSEEEPKPPDQAPSKVQPTSSESQSSRDPAEKRSSESGASSKTRSERTEESPSKSSREERDGGPSSSGSRNGSIEPSEESTKQRPPQTGNGYIYVLSRPTSRVYMNSRLLGTTPIMKRTVPPGRHTLVLVSPGFESKRVPVTVRPGETTQVRHLFNKGM